MGLQLSNLENGLSTHNENLAELRREMEHLRRCLLVAVPARGRVAAHELMRLCTSGGF